MANGKARLDKNIPVKLEPHTDAGVRAAIWLSYCFGMPKGSHRSTALLRELHSRTRFSDIKNQTERSTAKTTVAMERLCTLVLPVWQEPTKKTAIYNPRRPNLNTNLLAAHSPKDHSLWVRPHLIKQLREQSQVRTNLDTLSQESIGNLLHEDDTVAKILRDVTKDPNSPCDLSELSDYERAVLRLIFGYAKNERLPETIIIPGVVLLGSDTVNERGVYRLGIREDVSLADLSPVAKASVLRHRPGLFRDFPHTNLETWWKAADNEIVFEKTLERERKVFPEICEAILKAIEDDSARAPHDDVGGKDGLRRIFYSGFSDTPEDLGAQLCDAKKPLLHNINGYTANDLGRPRWSELTICTNLPHGKAIEAVGQHFGENDPATVVVRIFSQIHIKEYLSRYPWLWSQYFGRDQGFQIVKNDLPRIAGRLVAHPERRRLFVERSHLMPRHPSLDRYPFKPACRYLVVGGPKTGKSIALLQLLQMQPVDQPIVMLSSTCSPTEWRQCCAIIVSCEATFRRGWTVVIDDADRALYQYGTPRIIEQALGDLPATLVDAASMLIACARSAYVDLKKVIVLRPFRTLSLDHITEEYLTAVLTVYRPSLANSYFSPNYRGWALAKWGDSSIGFCVEACMEEPVFDLLSPVSETKDRLDAQWQERIRELAANPDIDAAVLRTLSAIRALGLSKVPAALIRAYVMSLAIPGDIDLSFRRLIDQGWIQQFGDRFTCDGHQFSLLWEELHGENELRRVTLWTADHAGDFDAPFTVTMLYRGALLAIANHDEQSGMMMLARLMLIRLSEAHMPPDDHLSFVLPLLIDCRLARHEQPALYQEIRDMLSVERDYKDWYGCIADLWGDAEFRDIAGWDMLATFYWRVHGSTGKQEDFEAQKRLYATNPTLPPTHPHRIGSMMERVIEVCRHAEDAKNKGSVTG